MNSYFTLDIPRTNRRVWRTLGRNVSLESGNLAMRVEAREFLYRQGVFDLEGITMAKWKQDYTRWKSDIGVKGQFHLVNTELEAAPDRLVYFIQSVKGYSPAGCGIIRVETPGIVFSDEDRGVAAMFKLAFCSL